MPLPLDTVLFNNINDIERVARRLIKVSLRFSLNQQDETGPFYQQLIVNTNGDTYFLEDILNLTKDEVARLEADKKTPFPKFWLRTPETIKNNSAPKLISLTELKIRLDGSLYSGLTFNQGLIETLRPHLQRIQAEHWLGILGDKAGGEVEALIAADPDFAKQCIKFPKGQIVYGPDFFKELASSQLSKKDNISFQVSDKNPNMSGSVTRTLSKAELRSIPKEEWEEKSKYLTFEYDESFPESIKATNGQIVYGLDFFKELTSSQLSKKDNISFQVSYKNPNMSGSVTITLSKAELRSIPKEEWEEESKYLTFEYDQTLFKQIVNLSKIDIFRKKLKEYNVDNNDPNLAKHLLKDTNDHTYVLEEIIDPKSILNSQAAPRFKLDDKRAPLSNKETKKALVRRALKFPKDLPKDITGKAYKLVDLNNPVNSEKLFSCIPDKIITTIEDGKKKKKKIVHTRWSSEEIQKIPQEEFASYYFEFDEDLAELLNDKIAINYMPPDPSDKTNIFWPYIAYNSRNYDKYSIRRTIRNKQAPDTFEYLTLEELVDNHALQSLLNLAYAGNLRFTEQLLIGNKKTDPKESITNSLTVAKSSLQAIKNELGNELGTADGWIERAKKKYNNATPQKTLAWLKRLKTINKISDYAFIGIAIFIILTAVCAAIWIVTAIVSAFVPGLAGFILAMISLGAFYGGIGCLGMSLFLGGVSWLMKKIWPIQVTNKDINLLKDYEPLVANYKDVLKDEEYFQELEKKTIKQPQINGPASAENLVPKTNKEHPKSTDLQVTDSEVNPSAPYQFVTSASKTLQRGTSTLSDNSNQNTPNAEPPVVQEVSQPDNQETKATNNDYRPS